MEDNSEEGKSSKITCPPLAWMENLFNYTSYPNRREMEGKFTWFSFLTANHHATWHSDYWFPSICSHQPFMDLWGAAGGRWGRHLGFIAPFIGAFSALLFGIGAAFFSLRKPKEVFPSSTPAPTTFLLSCEVQLSYVLPKTCRWGSSCANPCIFSWGFPRGFSPRSACIWLYQSACWRQVKTYLFRQNCFTIF